MPIQLTGIHAGLWHVKWRSRAGMLRCNIPFVSRLWHQPRLQLLMISTQFAGGLGRIRTILQGFVTQFEGQSLGRIHRLGLLGGDSEKRGVECRNIFLDLKWKCISSVTEGAGRSVGRPLTEVTAPRIVCALVFGTWVIKSIDVVSVPRHLGQGRSSLGHQLPEPIWR